MSQEPFTSQAYATAIVESSEDAILSKDLNGIIQSCNRATNALVKAIVELHGGTVEARSEGFGKGSEFIIDLPLAVAAI